MNGTDSSRTAVLLAALVFAVAAIGVFSFPPHHDIAWLLYAGGRVLDGADLYTDVIEVNPPLIVWISALAEMIARATGAWPTTVYRSIVLVLAALSLFLSARLLRNRFPGSSAAFGALLIVLAYLLVGAPAIDFGQREHLAVLLTLPWLLAVAFSIPAVRADGPETPAAPAQDPGPAQPFGRNAAIGLGILAGIGFALKPFFLLAWLLPEALLVRRRGPRALLRPGSLALLATLAGYGAAVLVLERDYLDVARIAAASYDGYYASDLGGMLSHSGARIALITLALWLGVRPFMPRCEMGDVLALAIAGFLAGVLVQRKGWDYHWIASTTLSWLLLATIAARVLEAGAMQRGGRRAWLAPTLAAGAVALGLATALAAAGSARQKDMRSGLTEFARVVGTQGGGSFVMLSTRMGPAFPLVNYLDARWGLRFNSLWPLPAMYPRSDGTQPFRYHPVEEMAPAERYMFDAVATDLARSRPGVLIVDRAPPGGVLRGFDYLAYFARDPRVAALLRDYSEVQPIGSHRIFIRRPAAGR